MDTNSIHLSKDDRHSDVSSSNAFRVSYTSSGSRMNSPPSPGSSSSRHVQDYGEGFGGSDEEFILLDQAGDDEEEKHKSAYTKSWPSDPREKMVSTGNNRKHKRPQWKPKLNCGRGKAKSEVKKFVCFHCAELQQQLEELNRRLEVKEDELTREKQMQDAVVRQITATADVKYQQDIASMQSKLESESRLVDALQDANKEWRRVLAEKNADHQREMEELKQRRDCDMKEANRDVTALVASNNSLRNELSKAEAKAKVDAVELESLQEQIKELNGKLSDANKLVSAVQKQNSIESRETLVKMQRDWESKKHLLSNELTVLRLDKQQHVEEVNALTLKVTTTQTELGKTMAELKTVKNELFEERSRNTGATCNAEEVAARLTCRCIELEAVCVRKSAINTILCTENRKLVAENAGMGRQLDELKQFEEKHNSLVKKLHNVLELELKSLPTGSRSQKAKRIPLTVDQRKDAPTPSPPEPSTQVKKRKMGTEQLRVEFNCNNGSQSQNRPVDE